MFYQPAGQGLCYLSCGPFWAPVPVVAVAVAAVGLPLVVEAVAVVAVGLPLVVEAVAAVGLPLVVEAVEGSRPSGLA